MGWVYMLVEKILEFGEVLFVWWCMDGMIGYDVFVEIDCFFVDGSGVGQFDCFDEWLCVEIGLFVVLLWYDLIYDMKWMIVDGLLWVEVCRLVCIFLYGIVDVDDVLVELLVCFFVYCLYLFEGCEYLCFVFMEVCWCCFDLVIVFVELELLLFDLCFEVVQCFLQVSGVVMVKGVEDIVFYWFIWFGMFIEVGVDFFIVVVSVEEFYCVQYVRFVVWFYLMMMFLMYDIKCFEDVWV